MSNLSSIFLSEPREQRTSTHINPNAQLTKTPLFDYSNSEKNITEVASRVETAIQMKQEAVERPFYDYSYSSDSESHSSSEENPRELQQPVLPSTRRSPMETPIGAKAGLVPKRSFYHPGYSDKENSV